MQGNRRASECCSWNLGRSVDDSMFPTFLVHTKTTVENYSNYYIQTLGKNILQSYANLDSEWHYKIDPAFDTVDIVFQHVETRFIII